MALKEIKLPSGTVLTLHEAPITEAHDLYQAVLSEVASVEFKVDGDDAKLGVEALIKNVICRGFASKNVHKAAIACFSKCIYGTEKLTMDTFDAAERRQDFIPVFTAVLEENIAPFAKGLWSVFESYLSLAQNTNTLR